MTTDTEARFCSLCARQAGLDPAGTGGHAFDTIIAAELPLPWPLGLFNDPVRIPDEITAVMQYLREEYARSQHMRISPIGIAPDRAYTVPGKRRVIAWQRPQGPFAHFGQVEYLVPEALLGPLFQTLALEPDRAHTFDAFRQPSEGVRDLLICTHGSVDAACSKFGFPTYRKLRQLAAESDGSLRAWRSTHFGGHVFAPTMIDLPHGSYWAYVENEKTECLAHRSGDVACLRCNYRGWSGLHSPFLQVLERELFVRHGWEWLNYAKQGCVLREDPQAQPDHHGHAQPQWAEVQLEFTPPQGLTQRVSARVEISNHIETAHSSGKSDTYAYPQYQIAWIQES